MVKNTAMYFIEANSLPTACRLQETLNQDSRAVGRAVACKRVLQQRQQVVTTNTPVGLTV